VQAHALGWPEAFIYAVYDQIFDQITTENTDYTVHIYVILANLTHAARLTSSTYLSVHNVA
jgi:hypothetical protein